MTFDELHNEYKQQEIGELICGLVVELSGVICRKYPEGVYNGGLTWDEQSILNKLCQISGVTFQSNENAAKYGYTDQKIQVGVIAQEVESVLPQVVVPAPFDIGKNEDGSEFSLSGENYKTVQYEKLVPLLIEAIKELKAEVDQLKNCKG